MEGHRPYGVISLCGFMGSGKSSVGRELSALLSCNLVDLDSYIENSCGMNIPEIFREKGESAFRDMELAALKSIAAGPIKEDRDSYTLTDGPTRFILSLGGGTLVTPECRRIVRNFTYCIYLRAGIGTLVSNLKDDCAGRPVLSARHDGKAPSEAMLERRICELMSGREPAYVSTAHLCIDIDGKSPREVAEEIADKLTIR